MENQSNTLKSDEGKLQKSTLPWIVLGIIVIGIAVLNLWLVFDKKPEPASEGASVPDFSLTNQQGHSLGLSDLAGKIWVADFIFTNCPTICPVMTREMARLQSEFTSEQINFVSFTVDPERDTSAVLSRYAVQYRADTQRWHFLTGEKEQIYQLANEGFKLSAAHHSGAFPHSTRFVLVSSDGNIYDYYDSRSRAALKRLRNDVRLLLGKQRI